ncbi:tRNA-splicing endonuclease subunit sen54 N-term-domain-containing protein [Whalleya microplaca]|nr:tRNA-splicing endonuclease subunit sen54 N-term-domain-containing protein [Whalleya microplaca]
MPFDDEDPTPAAPLPSASSSGAAGQDAEDDVPSLEDALADETQDFRLFSSLLNKRQASSKTIRRGEKDFESHGTRAQESVLEASRSAMHEVLSHTRSHKPRDCTRGWYFPDKWAGAPAEQQERVGGERASGLFAPDRVVALETEVRGPLGQTTGRVVTGVEKHTPGWLKTWLLPEEALYLIERGSLDLWWPARGIEDIFPVKREGESESKDPAEQGFAEHELGVPLSLQAAYALFIGRDGERGKVTLEKYQVYANLRRLGYKVLRAAYIPLPPTPPHKSPPHTLWEWLFSLLNPSSLPENPATPRPNGPLVKPGLYRSYNPIYAQLALIPPHKPTPTPTPHPSSSSGPPPEDPFRIHFHIWRSSSAFTKTKPPPPDFRIAVVDARTSSVPTLEELTALLESTPWDPPDPPRDGPGGDGGAGLMYRRLKHAWRNAVVAVVDCGLISYVRFGEMAFGEERLYEKVGTGRGGGKGKRGGRGGSGRGRGGAGAGGRGRGG